MILESVIDNLTAEGLLGTVIKSHVVLGYSGGRDSSALLFLLREIREKLPLTVTAAYFNHGWREWPAKELALIHQNCQESQTPLVIIQADRSLPKTESAARYARYQQLTQLATELRAQAVLTAHHADDQVETILFRILRGTGIEGLNGIQKKLILEPGWGVPVPILRPLLDTSRKKIQTYIHKKKLNFFEDPTNADVQHQRNQIRHDVLPYLEKSFPQVKNSLFRLGLVSSGDMEIVDESLQTLWSRLHHTDQSGDYLDGIIFNQLGLPYQRRILRRFLSLHDVHTDFQTIEDLLAFVRGDGRKNWDAALKSIPSPHKPPYSGKKPSEDKKSVAPYFLSLYKNKFRLITGDKLNRAVEKSTEISAVSVSIPGSCRLNDPAATLHISTWDAPDPVRFSPIRPNDSQQAFVDLSAFMDKPLEWRTRRPGDRFQPLGMPVPLKFKRFLINRGVPRFERDRIPVLAQGGLILWVPGLGINQAIKIKEQEKPTHLLKVSHHD